MIKSELCFHTEGKKCPDWFQSLEVFLKDKVKKMVKPLRGVRDWKCFWNTSQGQVCPFPVSNCSPDCLPQWSSKPLTSIVLVGKGVAQLSLVHLYLTDCPEEPGRLQTTGSQRAGHGFTTKQQPWLVTSNGPVGVIICCMIYCMQSIPVLWATKRVPPIKEVSA